MNEIQLSNGLRLYNIGYESKHINKVCFVFVILDYKQLYTVTCTLVYRK